MRIYVESGGKKAADLRLPGGLVVNRFTALFAPAWMKKSGVTLTAAQAQRVVSALRRCRRRFPGWRIVEVDCKNGDRVEISL